MSGPPEPSHHLLRTLAAVAPGSRIVLLDEEGRHARPLEALGFVVAPRPAGDAAHDWGVVWSASAGAMGLAALLASVRAAVVPGGWVWVGAAALGEPEELAALAAAAGLAAAEAPARERLGDLDAVRGVFRRVEAGTVG